jgi:excisionase family DNA binding protein
MNRMKLLSTAHAAQLLDVSPRTVARWCREDKMRGAVKLGRVWRIPIGTIRRWDP